MDSIILLHSFDSVRLSVVENIRRAQGPAGPVVVDRGRFQFSKLGKKFLDVGLSDSQVQVGNHQLAGASRGEAETGAASASSLEPVVEPLVVQTPRCRSRPRPHLSSTTTRPAAASTPTTTASSPAPGAGPGSSLGLGCRATTAGPGASSDHSTTSLPSSTTSSSACSSPSTASRPFVGLDDLIEAHINSVSH